MATLVELFIAGWNTRIAGIVSDKLRFPSEDGVTQYAIQLGAFGRTITIMLPTEADLISAPEIGTQVRGRVRVGRVKNGFGAVLKAKTTQLETPNTPGWSGPLTEEELISGHFFEGVGKVAKKESYIDKRDGSEHRTITVCAMGDTFSLRDVSPQIYDAVQEGSVYLCQGEMISDLRWSKSDGAQTSLSLSLQQMRRLKTEDAKASEKKPA